MTNLRTAAQQALEAMESAEVDPHSSDAVYKAITALQAALAEPVQEPVAWTHINGTSDTKRHQPQRKPEPNSDYERGFVDGMSEQARRSVDKAVNAMTKCKPLAEEEIKRLVSNDMVQFARAIERAHGIKE